jgi:hypothetical protein
MPHASYGRGMKIPVLFLGLTMATGVALAQTPPPVTPTKPADATKPANPSKPDIVIESGTAEKPAKPDAAKPDPKKKEKPKEEPMGTINGITIARPNGTFLGLTLVEGKFTLTFYNKKKKPMPVDVTRGIARWPNVHGPGDNRTVLNPSGNSLVGAQFVRGPYVFILFITLLKGEGDEAQAVENYTVQFSN